jgi:hypothetical protein
MIVREIVFDNKLLMMMMMMKNTSEEQRGASHWTFARPNSKEMLHFSELVYI